MKTNKIGVIETGQDGVIFGNCIFRFGPRGGCSVYDFDSLSDESVPFTRFVLDKADIITPHSNSVCFGSERFCDTDEFPLLYSNVYNNYAKTENPMCGVTCVYRLQRNGGEFTTTLVQLIETGFTGDPLWRSANIADVRPYGNCAIDTKNNIYYAFVMRDEDKTTRYFALPLPRVTDGEYDVALGVNRAVIKKEDILYYFDCEYHNYLQGACFKDGIIYSVEGFTDSKTSPPAIRLIDTAAKKQMQKHYFSDHGLPAEPEFIDFRGDICCYIDGRGNVVELEF